MTPKAISQTSGRLHFKLEPQTKLSAKWTPKNYSMYYSSRGRAAGQAEAAAEEER